MQRNKRKSLPSEFEFDDADIRLYLSIHRPNPLTQGSFKRISKLNDLVSENIEYWRCLKKALASLLIVTEKYNEKLTELYRTDLSVYKNFQDEVRLLQFQAGLNGSLWTGRIDDANLFRLHELRISYNQSLEKLFFQAESHGLISGELRDRENELRPLWLWAEQEDSELIFQCCLQVHDCVYEFRGLGEEMHNRIEVLLSLGAEKLYEEHADLEKTVEILHTDIAHTRSDLRRITVVTRRDYLPQREEGYTLREIAVCLDVEYQVVKRARKSLSKHRLFLSLDRKSGQKYQYNDAQVHKICESVWAHSTSYLKADKNTVRDSE